MRTLLLAALAVLALVGAGCGGDDELTSGTPKTTPNLTIPNSPVAEGDAADEDETTTTSTTSTTGGDDTTTGATGGTPSADPAAPSGGTPAPQTPAPSAPAPTPDDTGGAAEPTPEAPPEETGGAEAGGTSDFCAENPGAC